MAAKVVVSYYNFEGVFYVKLLCCADLRLGAECTEKLSVEQARKWRAVRAEKLESLFDKAARSNAGYLALFGQLFGAERVSESVIDGFFEVVRAEKQIQTLLFVNYEQFSRLSYRKDIPGNLYLLCTQSKDEYLDENVGAQIHQGIIELRLGRHKALQILPDRDGVYQILKAKEAWIVPSFEPLGFEDAQGKVFGFGIIEWTGRESGKWQECKEQRYAFETLEIKLLPEDGQKAILQKINSAVSKLDRDSFLRIRLIGRSAFGLTINADALASQLESRLFFVEVFDSTVMDIDTDAFETDISLRSEFVRLAMQDDSLSEVERNRLISCGWNALGGKEASEA